MGIDKPSVIPLSRQAGGNSPSVSLDPIGMTPAASPVDIRYTRSTRFFSRFTVGGVDALTYRTVHNADGSTSSMPFGLSTQTVIIGAVVGAAIFLLTSPCV